MYFNLFTSSSNFVDLLSSQQQNVIFGSVSDSVSLSSSQPPFFGVQGTEDSNFGEYTQARQKERRTWSPTDDVVLISSWLNTSKDAVIGNEQRSLAFWKRIAAYYNASPKLVGVKRERHRTVRIGGRRSMMSFASFVVPMKQLPERGPVDKTRMMS